MAGTDQKELDRAVASFLIEPDSGKALSILREARRIEIGSGSSGKIRDLAKAHKEDCKQLFDATLTLESDPEIVKRNMAARVISGFFPVLNSIEEFRTLEDRSWWDMLINGMSILSEIATSTQYLEATKLSTRSHNERALVTIEERLFSMASLAGNDMDARSSAIEDFLDEVRRIDIPVRSRPYIPFILWTLITILSYKQLRDVLK